MDKREICDILEHIGVLLEIKGESFFKSRAYYDAARTIELLDEDLENLVKEERLKEIKGIGSALSQKIGELVTTGRLEYYEKLKDSVPPGLLDMLKIPGLGPKKVKAIYEKLGIATLGELKYACIENRLLNLSGFGEKTQKKILEGIENIGKYTGQYLYPQAYELANQVVEALKKSGAAERVSVAGSLRRKKEVVKDMDILASSADSKSIMDVFTGLYVVKQVMSAGDTKSSVVLTNGINADLRVVHDREYPYALHHFTGSKEHNTALRHRAKQMGIKMNEYGLFKGEESIQCHDEMDIFEVLGLKYIPPEMRENNGEIEAAEKDELPVLVEESDIRGVFHVHSEYSDGVDSIETLAKYCIDKGWQYLGITDHSQSAYYAGGLKVNDIKRQHEEIDQLNEKYRQDDKYRGFKIFKGIELDILPDGSVDYNDEILSWFDFTIASVHSSFNLDEEKMTARIIKAISNKYVTMLGHVTGRLLLAREPYRLDMDTVLAAAVQNGVIVEINSNPHRLDIDWRFCRKARDMGVRFALNPDAHRADGMNDVVYGVGIARKGWLEKTDIVNCRSVDEVGKFLKIRLTAITENF